MLAEMKLSSKLVALATISSCASILLVCFILLLNDFRSYTKSEMERLDTISEMLKFNSEVPLRFFDVEAANEMLGYVENTPMIEQAIVFDTSNGVFASYPEGLLVATPTDLDFGVSSFGVTIQYFDEIWAGQELLGYLFVSGTLEDKSDRLFRIFVLGMVSMFASIAFAWLIASRLQRYISQPILDLVSATRRVIAFGDYGIRVDKRWNDEIGQLVDGINEMLGRIQKRDSKLLKHKNELEALVDEKTVDLRIANTKLLNQKERAEKASLAKGEFLAVMSHELRTPMNAIVGMTSLLMDSSLNVEQQDFVETIHNSSDTLLNLINDILDFSKIESGKMELEHEPVNLRNCAEDSLDLLAIAASEKLVNLVYRIDDNVPAMIKGDRIRLRQILVNLLSNAVKFTSEGEIRLSIRLREMKPTSAIIDFSVRDSGIGIPDEKISELFTNFTQVDTSTTRKYGGTGLGLAICKRLVHAMGGEIRVESEEGVGSVFRFWIECGLHQAERPNLLELQPDLNGKSVLIIDEFESNRLLIEEHTRIWGMKSLIRANLEGGLEALEEEKRIDYVIIGLGKEITENRTIKMIGSTFRNPRFAKTRKLLIGQRGTSLTMAESRGFETLLSKPIRPGRLLSLMKKDLFDDDRTNGSIRDDLADDINNALKEVEILLVEDNKVNQKVAKLMLGRFGLEVDIASDGQEAVNIVRKRDYDIVLMDIQMPVKDGITATKEIREMDFSNRKEPWIIALTAHATEGFKSVAIESGVDSIIVKPIRRETLYQSLMKFATLKRDQTAAA